MDIKKWAIVGLGCFVGLAAISYLTPNPPDVPNTTPSPATSIAASPTSICVRAAGKIWSGVKLYEDEGCKALYGTVMGGGIIEEKGDKVKGLKIQLEDGTNRWVLRNGAMRQLFVKSDDPAIEGQQWIEF